MLAPLLHLLFVAVAKRLTPPHEESLVSAKEFTLTEALALVVKHYTSATGSKVAEFGADFIEFMNQCTDPDLKAAWSTVCAHCPTGTTTPVHLQQLVRTTCTENITGFDLVSTGCKDGADLALDADGTSVHNLKAYKESLDVLDNIRYLYLTSYNYKFLLKGGSHLDNLREDVVRNWDAVKADEVVRAATEVAKEDFNRVNQALGGRLVDKVMSWSKCFLTPSAVLDCQRQLKAVGEETADLKSCSAFGSDGAFRALPFLIEGSKGARIDYVYIDLALKIKRPLVDEAAVSKRSSRRRLT